MRIKFTQVIFNQSQIQQASKFTYAMEKMCFQFTSRILNSNVRFQISVFQAGCNSLTTPTGEFSSRVIDNCQVMRNYFRKILFFNGI